MTHGADGVAVEVAKTNYAPNWEGAHAAAIRSEIELWHRAMPAHWLTERDAYIQI